MAPARVKGGYIDSHESIKMFRCAKKCVEVTRRSGDRNQKTYAFAALFWGNKFYHEHKLIPLQASQGKSKCVHLHYPVSVECYFHYVFLFLKKQNMTNSI